MDGYTNHECMTDENFRLKSFGGSDIYAFYGIWQRSEARISCPLNLRVIIQHSFSPHILQVYRTSKGRRKIFNGLPTPPNA